MLQVFYSGVYWEIQKVNTDFIAKHNGPLLALEISMGTQKVNQPSDETVSQVFSYFKNTCFLSWPLAQSANNRLGLELNVYSYENAEKVGGRCSLFCTEPCFAHASLSTAAIMHRGAKNLKLWVYIYSLRDGFIDKD